jgi:lysophospholipase L1-like esterase
MKKHIVCFGDSNTHGYCADPTDTADGTNRFTEAERWPCVLQQLLGDDYYILEEGLSGRTTVFDDPIHGDLAGVDYIRPCLISHEPVDLLIIMLGTNDTKERFGCSAAAIAVGMQRLVRAAQNAECWGANGSNILVVAPPPIGDELQDAAMGNGCPEKSRGLAEAYAAAAQVLGVHFLDANGCEFNNIDHMHLTRQGHSQLAHRLAELIPSIM